MHRLVVVVAAATTAFGVTAASASALRIGSGDGTKTAVLQQSDHISATCQPDDKPVSVRYQVSNGAQGLAGLVLGGISQHCDGAQLGVLLDTTSGPVQLPVATIDVPKDA